MSRRLLIPFLLALSGCASKMHWWDGTVEWENDGIAIVKGWLYTPPSGGIFICPGMLIGVGGEADCLDVAFAEGVNVVMGEPRVITVRGIFRQYSKEFVGLGNLRSEIGLLEQVHVVDAGKIVSTPRK